MNSEFEALNNAISEMAESNSNNAYESTRISQDVSQIQSICDGLQVSVDKIHSIMDELEKNNSNIPSVASQTNLLALNASIEAARVGEAGRGFERNSKQIQ